MPHNLDAALAGVLFFAAMLSPSEEMRSFCFAGVGACLGGFLGASLFPPIKEDRGRKIPDSKKLGTRWGVNFLFALLLGPATTNWLAPKCPDIPFYTLTVTVSGILGMLGVTVLLFASPYLFRKFRQLLLNGNAGNTGNNERPD